jgi:hypothetical protein
MSIVVVMNHASYDRTTGQLDEGGLKQLALLALALKALGMGGKNTKIVTSPTFRSLQSAVRLAEHLEIVKVQTNPVLEDEVAYPYWSPPDHKIDCGCNSCCNHRGNWINLVANKKYDYDSVNTVLITHGPSIDHVRNHYNWCRHRHSAGYVVYWGSNECPPTLITI